MKTAIHISGAPLPIGPYSQGILANGMLYISGQIPVDPFTQLRTTGNIEVQTRQVMENLKAILKEAGMDFTDVVKVSIFLADLNDFAAMNAVYASYFRQSPPARETVQVAGLPLGSGIEISLMATKTD